MKIEKDVSKSQDPFNPKDLLNQLLELGDRATEVILADREDALEELLLINAEVTRLEKLRKDYNKQMTAFMKNN